MELKFCTACHTHKDLGEFGESSKRKSGIKNRCKVCVSNKVKASEAWKTIPNYSRYEASTYGRIRRKDTGYIYKPSVKNAKENNNYLRIVIYNDLNNYKKNYVHRLIALTWIPNKDKEKTQVNHLKNKYTNKVNYLSWVSPSENIKHAYENIIKHKTTKIHQYNLNNNFIRTYSSIKEASRIMNYNNPTMISRCLRNLIKNYKGYIWKYYKA